MTEDMRLETHLLAVKLFRPASSLGKVTGEVVMKWVRQVLAQNGLKPEDFAGAVSDNGSDVSTGVGSVFRREWCLPHMFNRAMVDGLGVANERRLSKNLLGRELLDGGKKVVEHFNRSGGAKVSVHASENVGEYETRCLRAGNKLSGFPPGGGGYSFFHRYSAALSRWGTIHFFCLHKDSSSVARKML